MDVRLLLERLADVTCTISEQEGGRHHHHPGYPETLIVALGARPTGKYQRTWSNFEQEERAVAPEDDGTPLLRALLHLEMLSNETSYEGECDLWRHVLCNVNFASSYSILFRYIGIVLLLEVARLAR